MNKINILPILIIIFIFCVAVFEIYAFIYGKYECLPNSNQPVESCNYIPPSDNCNDYVKSMDQWIKQSDKSEEKFLNCQLDLARCQNESNADRICITPNCE